MSIKRLISFFIRIFGPFFMVCFLLMGSITGGIVCLGVLMLYELVYEGFVRRREKQ